MRRRLGAPARRELGSASTSATRQAPRATSRPSPSRSRHSLEQDTEYARGHDEHRLGDAFDADQEAERDQAMSTVGTSKIARRPSTNAAPAMRRVAAAVTPSTNAFTRGSLRPSAGSTRAGMTTSR